ncbi:MAG: ATP-dependent RNA helicase DbpA [Gammaproteobacteria bacterium]|nr:ATP-dependent RNA helicase DbpA [Gammaproteobacteria bacterium]
MEPHNPQSSDFSSLSLRAELLESLNLLGYKKMTPVQAESLPITLAGKDILAQAETGSGKTAAFGLRMLNTLDSKKYSTQSLVICPTRELADQVSIEIRQLAKFMPNIKVLTLCGGKPLGAQLNSLKRHPHIIVGTPGRILQHLKKGSLNLKDTSTLVLDEADRMLSMGFIDDIEFIIQECPDERQTLLFSATYPEEILKISSSYQQQPTTLTIQSSAKTANIKQKFYHASRDDRLEKLNAILKKFRPESTLIFCNQKAQAQQLQADLIKIGHHALSLHGDLEQFDRDQTLIRFANRSTSILVATDVAARGIDVEKIELVVNYELPAEPETYIHRMGRTGRAGHEGLAASLVLPSEEYRFKRIMKLLKVDIHIDSMPVQPRESVFKLYPPNTTLFINSGRKHKISAGDIVGALTATKEISGDSLGKINILENISYIAIKNTSSKAAIKILSEIRIKGRKIRVKNLN